MIIAAAKELHGFAEVFWLLVGLAIFLIVWWLPTLVAASRGLPLRRIAWLNFFLGHWAFRAVREATRRAQQPPPPSSWSSPEGGG